MEPRRFSTKNGLDSVICPLALVGAASYPVSVRQPVGSFPAAFSAALASAALRFPWVPVTKSPEDSHLQVSAHAGHTNHRGREDFLALDETPQPWVDYCPEVSTRVSAADLP